MEIEIKLMDPMRNAQLKKLLADADLPFEDVDAHLNNFLIAELDNEMIGAIGLEKYNHIALLRSFVVDEKYRNHKIGQKLFDELLSHAKSKHIGTIYLLTETAEKFFSRNGFLPTDRSSVPPEIQNTTEFKSICPSSALIMKKNLTEK